MKALNFKVGSVVFTSDAGRVVVTEVNYDKKHGAWISFGTDESGTSVWFYNTDVYKVISL